MNHYTTPCDLVLTPTEQCIFYVFWEIPWKIENLEDSSNGSVEAVVARWLSAPNLNFGSMMEYLQAHKDLRLEDVIYSLSDFKDFDKWISYVDEFELRNDHYTYQQNQARASPPVRTEAADVEPVLPSAIALEDDEGRLPHQLEDDKTAYAEAKEDASAHIPTLEAWLNEVVPPECKQSTVTLV
ncbi:MAG: hypothetical protein Q9175_006126 [Cornicularia normoerica]